MNTMNSSSWPDEGFDLALLNGVANRISEAVPLPEVLNDTVGFVTEILNCNSCMIYVLEGEYFVLRASRLMGAGFRIACSISSLP